MADNKRDIELRIAATTSGSDAVNKLAQQLESLAKEGGDAAPKFKELATEIRKIGEQGDAVKALDELEQKVQGTTNALFDATGKVNDLAAALQAQRDKTEQYKDTQQLLRTALDGTNEQIRKVEAAQRTLRAETDRSEKATIGYKQQAQALTTQLADLRNKQSEQRATLEQANRAYAEQSRELRKLNTEYTAASRSAKTLESALAGQSAAVDKSKASLGDLGVATTDAANALTQVETALGDVTAKAGAAEAAFKQLRSIEEAVARSNERNAAIAKQAAEQRAAAAARVAAAEREAASVTEAAALRQKLAQQELEGQLRDTETAQKALNDAFGRTGVRSAQAIQSEINEIVRSLDALRTNASVSGAEFDRAFAGAQRRLQGLQAELQQTPDAIRSAGRETNLLTEGFRQLAAVYGGIELATKFFDANKQIETLRRSLALVTGSTDEANRAIALLQDTANKAGVAVGEISDSYIKFRASLDGANVPLETTESLFRAVTNASGQLGLSSNKTSLILEALAQTANKGVVSMEELRQQLGDSLPGALDLTAKGLGITTAELVKLTESGQLLTADFLPALRDALVKTYGDGEKAVDSFAAAWNRFKNELTQVSQIIGTDGGLLTILKERVDETTSSIGTASSLVDFFAQSLRVLNEGANNLDLTSPFSSGEAARDKLLQQFDVLKLRLQGVSEAEVQATIAKQKANAAAAESITQTVDLTDATEKATQAATASARGWAQVSVEYAGLRSEIEGQISVAEKLSAAKKIEGEARLAIVEIAGDEAAVLRESAAAAAEETQALTLVAERRQTEVDLLIRQRDELVALAAALGDPGGQRAKEIEAINASIAARTAETEKASQSAEASRIDAQAKALAVQTYNDNAAALGSLKIAYDKAREALVATTAAQAQGLATSAQVQAAQERLSVAEALYRDAVGDSAAALERKTRAAQGALTVTEAQINLEREKINTELQSAQAMGNSAAVLQSTIALKQLDIKLIEAKIAALKIEAQALREQAAAELAALQATDPLLAQKKAEIELRLQNAKAKELEAQRNTEVIKQINLEIDALRQRGVQSGVTSNNYVNDREREIAANDKVRASVEELAAAERKRRGVDANGFSTGIDGQTINAAGPTYTSIYNQLKSRGLSDAQARSVAEEFVDSRGNVTYSNNPGQLKYGGRNSTLEFAVDRAAEKFLRNGTAGVDAPAGQGGPFGGTAGSQYSVNVTIGGRSTTVNTASQSDAQTLVSLFASLDAAANRAGGG